MKAPIVEVLEERAMEAAEERAAAAVGSAAADDTEELRAPEAAVAAALGVLSRGTDTLRQLCSRPCTQRTL